MKGPTLFGMLHFCVQMFLSGKCFALDWSLSTSPLPPPPKKACFRWDLKVLFGTPSLFTCLSERFKRPCMCPPGPDYPVGTRGMYQGLTRLIVSLHPTHPPHSDHGGGQNRQTFSMLGQACRGEGEGEAFFSGTS